MNTLLIVLSSVLGGVITSLVFMWLYPPTPFVGLHTQQVDFKTLPKELQERLMKEFPE